MTERKRDLAHNLNMDEEMDSSLPKIRDMHQEIAVEKVLFTKLTEGLYTTTTTA